MDKDINEKNFMKWNNAYNLVECYTNVNFLVLISVPWLCEMLPLEEDE